MGFLRRMTLQGRSILVGALMVALGTGLALGQDARPDAAVAPVAALGDFSPAQIRIIKNRLDNELSKSFRLIPTKEYQRAEESAFQALGAAECTEESCILKILEFLQVDRLFVLQIIKEGPLVQLSLTLARSDQRQVVEDLCRNCDLEELYQRVERLVARLVGGGRQELAAIPRPEPPPDPYQEALSGWRWKWGSSLVVGLLLGANGILEAQSVAESNSKQARLEKEIQRATTPAAYDAALRAIKKERSNGEGHKANSDLSFALSAVLLGLAGWIYLDEPEPGTVSRWLPSLDLSAERTALAVAWRF